MYKILNFWLSISPMIFLGQTMLLSSLPKPVADWAYLHHAKSFLGTPELLSTYKTFIHNLIEECSPLLDGAPASHLVQLENMETKALKITGISCDEAVCGPTPFTLQTGWWSQKHCSPSLINFSFSCLWNHLTHSLQFISSFQVFKTAVHDHLR